MYERNSFPSCRDFQTCTCYSLSVPWCPCSAWPQFKWYITDCGRSCAPVFSRLTLQCHNHHHLSHKSAPSAPTGCQLLPLPPAPCIPSPYSSSIYLCTWLVSQREGERERERHNGTGEDVTWQGATLNEHIIFHTRFATLLKLSARLTPSLSPHRYCHLRVSSAILNCFRVQSPEAGCECSAECQLKQHSKLL